jgi:hypothetical protein
MADNETIAAVLAAGMLQPVGPPAAGSDGIVPQREQTRFVLDVLHAVALYRAVLEALDQTNARQVRGRDGMTAQPEHGDTPVPEFANAAKSASAVPLRVVVRADSSVT